MLPSRCENAADAVFSPPHSCLTTPCPTHCSPAHANVCPIRMHRLILGLSTLTTLYNRDIPHGESFLALGFASLCSAVPSPLSYPTPGLLMDIPSTKTGQQLYNINNSNTTVVVTVIVTRPAIIATLSYPLPAPINFIQSHTAYALPPQPRLRAAVPPTSHHHC